MPYVTNPQSFIRLQASFVFCNGRFCRHVITTKAMAVWPVFPLPHRFMKLAGPGLLEVSGIADSKTNPGYLWVQEDSGNPPNIELLQHDGTWLKTIHLANVVNRDWEDIVLSTGPKARSIPLYCRNRRQFTGACRLCRLPVGRTGCCNRYGTPG